LATPIINSDTRGAKKGGGGDRKTHEVQFALRPRGFIAGISQGRRKGGWEVAGDEGGRGLGKTRDRSILDYFSRIPQGLEKKENLRNLEKVARG